MVVILRFSPALMRKTLLRGVIHDLNEQLVTGTASLIKNWLENIPPARRLIVLEDRAGELFSYPVALVI